MFKNLPKMSHCLTWLLRFFLDHCCSAANCHRMTSFCCYKAAYYSYWCYSCICNCCCYCCICCYMYCCMAGQMTATKFDFFFCYFIYPLPLPIFFSHLQTYFETFVAVAVSVYFFQFQLSFVSINAVTVIRAPLC